ncbi:MAG: hypothetical protein WDA41_10895 [Candidatus Neomarinimicrobiota bacterium]
MSYWTMYWITRLDAISVLFCFFAVMAGIFLFAFLVMSIYHLSESEERYNDDESRLTHIHKAKSWVKFAKISGVTFVVMSLIVCLIPSTRSAIAIWAVPKVINNEQVQALPDNALKLVNAQLQEWLKDVSGEVAREEPGK